MQSITFNNPSLTGQGLTEFKSKRYMLQGRMGRRRPTPQFTVVVKKSRAAGNSHEKSDPSVIGIPSRKRYPTFRDAPNGDAEARALPAGRDAQSVGDSAPPRTQANRILPSLASQEAEEARIREEIEAYKARWRPAKPCGTGQDGHPERARARKRPILEEAVASHDLPASEERVTLPRDLITTGRSTRDRVSFLDRIIPRHVRKAASEPRRGDRWKRRLPKTCW